ncbi:ATP-dependent RNA helicase dbp8 [Zancudomyces culisetae]|uniref:ATP-dependent RNA helicase dbp8 n=1 Tax=Zancudomyces culisetae TaxID=1213189 RepID=A0A1R1PM35_ZANCU|nr:ATP-dependent RNA helicase dbp8 [Zancudomyces culisetae]|eukprot:OMH82025.1 ATP-dependent RNA helicase dbp8 [Zancudomyces culisetae]
MSQHQRLESIEAFKAHKSNILISTSVGSRGLDIPAVEMVVNFDLPLDTDDYIHRVGRTARAGRPGDAVSLVSEKDVELVHAIEERVGCLLEEYPAISEKEGGCCYNAQNRKSRCSIFQRCTTPTPTSGHSRIDISIDTVTTTTTTTETNTTQTKTALLF